MATPPPPRLIVIGAAGSQVKRYAVAAVNTLGQDTIISAFTQINNAPDVLNGVNFVLIVAAPVPGAVAYRVYVTDLNTTLTNSIVGQRADGSILSADTGQGNTPTVGATAEPAHWIPALPIGSDHYISGGPSVAGAGLTVTLTGVLGFTHAITKLKIYKFAAALLAAAAAPVIVTTTNMGGIVFPFPADAAPQGSIYTEDWSPGLSPARGIAQFTNTVWTCPATPNVIWTINGAFYFAS